MTFTDRACRSIILSALLIVLPTFDTSAGASPQVAFEFKSDKLLMKRDAETLEVSLKSPLLQLDDGKSVGGESPLAVTGDLSDGKIVEVTYAPMSLAPSTSVEVVLSLQWSEAESLLRKWARVRLIGSQSNPALLQEVVLDRIDVQDRPVATHGQQAKDGTIIFGPYRSHPVFMPGVFLGIEFPAASTRCENAQVVLAHRPGTLLKMGEWYETRKAVYGIAAVGEEVPAFKRYITAHRPKPQGIHVNYNSWWTSHYPGYTEEEILGLMKIWEDELWKARGVALDSFCIDLGWSDKNSIWEINHERFPAEFARLQEAARRMHSNLGLWISPSSYYPEGLDGEWAKSQGYETQKLPSLRTLCLGGPHYAERFKSRLTDMVGRYDMSHLKFDGISLECPESDHGHGPGPLSWEAIAEGMIAAMTAAREANPNVWLEPTCFGSNASPWWLFYANSVTGAFGDDAPAGRIPAPIYRESYTSAKDYFNLQGAYLLPTPINAQELLGIVHQTPDPMTNDAVMCVLRGNMFLSLYVNPQFMDERRWDALADLLKWARNNEQSLQNTVVLLPVSWQGGDVPHLTDDGEMPREPYGYAHIQNDTGLIALRNPWIAPQTYTLKLDKQLGLSPDAQDLSFVSLYPEPRVYAEKLKFGESLQVALAPYETVVLKMGSKQATEGLPSASTAVQSHLKLNACEHKIQRVSFKKSSSIIGPNWTSQVGDIASAVRLTCDANVRVDAPKAELLILCEGEKAPETPVGTLKVNGRKVEMDNTSSAYGWNATGLPVREHWTFLRAPLQTGDNAIALEQFIGDGCTRVSTWVWATKPGEATSYSNALPAPEAISLDGVALFPAESLTELESKPAQLARPVDRIKGVFLDSIEPVSVTQGAGTLQKNRALTEKPLAIGGRRFVRGLGTHAPSKIVYSLGGKYRRFQSWAGADANTSPTVTFEVWVDGERKWESKLMTRNDQPEWVDLDVSGAQTLELIVGNGGDSAADHADWADAKLLK